MFPLFRSERMIVITRIFVDDNTNLLNHTIRLVILSDPRSDQRQMLSYLEMEAYCVKMKKILQRRSNYMYLGIMYSSRLCWTRANQTLASQADRVVFAIKIEKEWPCRFLQGWGKNKKFHAGLPYPNPNCVNRY